MSNQKTLALAFCKENSSIVNTIMTDLRAANYQFEQFSCSRSNSFSSLHRKTQGTDLPVILLISDNFLKSTECMASALSMYQELEKKRQLLPVIIPGLVRNENGVWEEVRTSFERVSNVIQYMNFWQDKYLELRKQKRGIPAAEEEQFNDKLRVVREISSEVGEFLRHVRSSVHYDYAGFRAKDYEVLFRFAKDEVGYQAFRSGAAVMVSADVMEVEEIANGKSNSFTPPAAVEIPELPVVSDAPEAEEGQALVDLIQSSKDDIMRENKVEDALNAVAEVPEIDTPPSAEEIAEDVPEAPAIDLTTTTESAEDELVEMMDDLSEVEIPAVEIPAVEIPAVEAEAEAIPEIKPMEISPTAEEADEMMEQTIAEVAETAEEKLIEEAIPPVDLMDIPGIKEVEEAAAHLEAEPVVEQAEVPVLDEKEEAYIQQMMEKEAGIAALESAFAEKAAEEVEEPAGEKTTASLDDVLVEDEEVTQHEPVNTDFQALVEEVIQEEEALAAAVADDSAVTQQVAPIHLEDIIETEMDLAEGDLVVSVSQGLENQEISIENVLVAGTLDEVVEEAIEVEDKLLAGVEIEDESPVVAPNLPSWEEIAETAKNLVQAKEMDQALNTLKGGIEIYPEVTELRHFYALVLAKHALHFSAATEQLEAILDQDNQHSDAYFLLAEIAEFNKDFIMAKSYYDKTVELENDYPNAHYRLGVVLSTQFEDQEESAFEHFKTATKQDKRNADAHYQAGILLRDYFKKPAKAVKQFKKTIKLQGRHPYAFYDLAVAHHQLNDSKAAAWSYQRAIEVNPELQTAKNDEAFNTTENTAPDTVVESEQTDDKMAQLQRDIERLEKQLTQVQQVVEDKVTAPSVLAVTLDDLDKTKNGKKAKIAPVEIVVEAAAPEVPEAKELGKIVFITGATSGIGKATAERFAKEGYRLIITGRREARLEALKDDFVKNYGVDVKTLNFDVRQLDKIVLSINQLEKEWRNIDILINNAGLAKGFSDIHEGELRHWEQMIDTNIKGLLYMTRAIAPHMVERKSGQIINVCSTAGHEVYPKGNVYCATKYAVNALTKSMRIDLHKHNIRVSQVSPGHVEETEFAKVRFDGNEERAKIYDDFKPLRSSDVADIIYFMATRPAHVNVQDVLVMGTQQASSNHIDRSGR